LALSLGIDIGAISVKLALLGGRTDRRALSQAAARLPSFQLLTSPDDVPPVLLSEYRRVRGEPLRAVQELLAELCEAVTPSQIAGLRAVGSGARLLAERLDAPQENEYRALAAASGLLHPEARCVVEMGGEAAKFLLLDGTDDGLEIRDYASSGDCAAGTGSFLDQQASRLHFAVEEVSERAGQAERAARIAGRCSVFAKSDMIHAQQKGYSPEEILRGLCDAVSRNYKGNIARGKKAAPPVLFVGGVAQNEAVRRSLCEVWKLSDGELIAPPTGPWFGAIGAALLARDAVVERGKGDGAAATRAAAGKATAGGNGDTPAPVLDLDRLLAAAGNGNGFESQAPLDLGHVELLRHRASPRSTNQLKPGEPVYLGVDVGSVSTNLVVIDAEGELVHEIYLRTRGRPIAVVSEGLAEIQSLLGERVELRGVGTTGSGRELVGELLGADTVNDEITAHKTGATYIARRLTGKEVDTIFEIGGQDSKFISLDRGVVVDFAMNEACAAGTGSFLEEQAERMGISIVDEFADLALNSDAPIRLGERCTVFMERDLNAQLQRGAAKPDLCAGLAYSIVLNYLNRVVRGRRVGEVIYFQGGTAYNDAVAAAFSKVLGKPIIVPPHNGVVGAIGMALLAKEKAEATGRPSSFRGWEVEKIDYKLRKFTCKACSNVCDMEEFTVDDVKTYWGDKCSDRYRRRARSEREPVAPDLVALKRGWLSGVHENRKNQGAERRVGVPRAMYYYDRFPFWATWLDELGVDIVLSDPTNRELAQAGLEYTVAEPCHPINVAHGHIHQLLARDADWILLPNVINAEASPDQLESYLCPWGQTLPFVAGSSPAMEAARERLLMPTLRFREGEGHVKKVLRKAAARFGAGGRESDRAVTTAYAAQRDFDARVKAAGREARAAIREAGRDAILLLGRPYNLYDNGVNMGIPAKLRDFYGVDVLPLDFLALSDVDIRELNANMFWNYGRDILAASLLAAEDPKLHVIYITNFKCGPDSFIKQYVGEASGRPYLTLQFDGHANDAGALTRCEAYLDSKGVLRWWSPQARAATA